MIKDQSPALSRPENKGVVDRSSGSVQPWQLDPDLAQLKMAEMMIARLGTPYKVSKEFISRYGIFSALQHSPTNPTGFDCELRLKAYRKVAELSVNEDGMYFNNFWAYMMKPKYVINGMQLGQAEDQKQSIIGRVFNWFRGGKKNDNSTNGN